MLGDPQSGGHHGITGALLNATHQAIALHPHPARKAAFAKILASLAAEQAKDHASGSGGGRPGGDLLQGPPLLGSGYAGPAPPGLAATQPGGIFDYRQPPQLGQAAPHQRVFQPLMPEDNGGAPDGELIRAPLGFPYAHHRRLGGVQMPEPTGYPAGVPSISQSLVDAVRNQAFPPRY